MKKVHITSLGCAKNLVDSEVLGGQLRRRSYKLIQNPEDADIIIINTCGFIEDSKKESLQAIFEAVEITRDDQKKKLFVTGCLSQRYKKELEKEIPEIDAVFGTEDYENILRTLGEDNFNAEEMYRVRELTTPNHFAYIKISEGCDHTCAFCAIPGIRGKHRSRSIDSILDEARVIAESGVKEIILVSQDTSAYGRDIYGKPKTVELLSRLADEQMFSWIRPLYWYPSNFPLKYIELMNKYDTMVPYLDMPIQHASDNVLRNMRRGETNRSLYKLYNSIRDIRPDIVLRTTLILGHPGETEDDCKQLKKFIQETRFDRVGSFLYSDEEGTTAFDIPEKVDPEIAMQRRDELMKIQKEISEEKNRSLIGTVQTILVDNMDDSEKICTGRTFRDAPEIDNEVSVKITSQSENIVGTMQNVRITDAAEYDLYGEFLIQ